MTTIKSTIIHGPRFSDPVTYGWAVDKTAGDRSNFWVAPEVPMGRDIAQWKGGDLSEDEQRIVKRNLGFFITADSLAANNIVLGTLRHLRPKECRDFLYRQAYDEGVHTEAYVYIVESLGLDQGEISNMYHEIPSIAHKDEFLLPFIEVLSDPLFETGSVENDRLFIKSLFAFACIMEGLFFYVGFVQLLALGRQNKLVGGSQQYQFILRDESLHCNFGADLINQIKIEHPELWTDELKAELSALMAQGVELEYAYAEDTMPRGVLGMNKEQFKEYLRFIANRRLLQVGIDPLYDNPTNPFPWMSEIIDLRKEAAFFETRNLEYRQGSDLEWS